VPDTILLKSGPLTDEEWRVMRTHPEVGYTILRISPNLADVAELIYSHQERFDGSGYPRGLRGEAIPLGARVFAVIDAYDAMRSHRPYRQPMSTEQAVDQIRRGSGSQFDPVVVQAFMRCQPELERIGQWPPK
jgi:response regulator RpfG family c-di-GMP phosphodiesterase